MPTLMTIGKVKVRVYAGEHGRPHFHLVGVDSAAVVAIESLEVLEGALDRTLQEAFRWASENIDVIRSQWDRLNGGLA
ncbi:MAG: DUF4160 domain-containing protein [Desulfovibrionaceae bacterium]